MEIKILGIKIDVLKNVEYPYVVHCFIYDDIIYKINVDIILLDLLKDKEISFLYDWASYRKMCHGPDVTASKKEIEKATNQVLIDFLIGISDKEEVYKKLKNAMTCVQFDSTPTGHKYNKIYRKFIVAKCLAENNLFLDH